MAGALIMPISFLIGSRYGTLGLARAWLFGFPILTAATIAMSLPVIGAKPIALARAIAPGLLASAAMAAVVAALDSILPPMAPPARLAILAGTGASAYGLLLFAFARSIVEEVLNLALGRTAAQAL